MAKSGIRREKLMAHYLSDSTQDLQNAIIVKQNANALVNNNNAFAAGLSQGVAFAKAMMRATHRMKTVPRCLFEVLNTSSREYIAANQIRAGLMGAICTSVIQEVTRPYFSYNEAYDYRTSTDNSTNQWSTSSSTTIDLNDQYLYAGRSWHDSGTLSPAARRTFEIVEEETCYALVTKCVENLLSCAKPYYDESGAMTMQEINKRLLNPHTEYPLIRQGIDEAIGTYMYYFTQSSELETNLMATTLWPAL
jgi:hypothetical protein